jgi:formylglycine-generating enzyme required for sulfatase activity
MRERDGERIARVLLAGALTVVPVRAVCQSAAAGLQPYRDSIPGTLVTFEMVPLPAGPATRPLWIGRTEVTWDMYDVFALGLDASDTSGGADATARPSRPYGAPDYGYGHRGYPVISVTRAAAEAFCAWLSAKSGNKYRLPTDAEWQHAAQLALGSGPLPAEQREALVWHTENADGKTHPVASKRADRLGLHDLLGNAAEWVMADELVVRGGSFRTEPDRLAAGAQQDESWNERDPQIPKSRWWLSDGPFVGFRIVREP